jgi:hypothetical protein
MGNYTFQGQAEKKLYTVHHYLNMIPEFKLLGTAVMWLTCIHTTERVLTGFTMNTYLSCFSSLTTEKCQERILTLSDRAWY